MKLMSRKELYAFSITMVISIALIVSGIILHNYIIEAIGLLLILGVASELLAKGSHVLEQQFGSGFTGSVILGFITMLPELIFVLITVREARQASGDIDKEFFDIALGSAVGGNILLFTLGFGMVIFIAYYKHNETIKLPVTLKDDLYYLLAGTLYLLGVAVFRGSEGFHLIDGIILFIMYFVFVIHQYIETRGIEMDDDRAPPTQKDWIISISLMIGGGIGILLAAEPFVHSIVEIANDFGVSAIVLALIISPIASELPEKISAFVLASRDLDGVNVAVANFIGSKVQASTLLFGSMVLYKIYLFGGTFEILNIGTFVNIMLAILTTLVGVFVLYDLKINIKEGIFVVLLYFASITVSILYA